MSEEPISSFRPVPRTGVIYVTAEASRRGYHSGAVDWCNLGQGQPEIGPLEGAPERRRAIEIRLDDQEYGPVAGVRELRQAVAELYNHLYRRGRGSQYTWENVCVSGGGRSSLTRAAASLGAVNLGHFLPDYTAYEELLDVFKAFTAIPILLDGTRGYEFTVDELRHEISGRGLGAILLSNPCNPTGRLIDGADLEGWVQSCRELDCALLVDEFYSHYVYGEGPAPRMASAARYVDDVDRDPVLIFDGLTKNWRYPGWRVSWTLGPRRVVEALASAGSFLDGGASRPLQRAAVELLREEDVLRESRAIQACFGAKRRRMLQGLAELGVRIDRAPDATFYCWGSVAGLPGSISDGMSFFRAALDAKVITVPGEFFDVNPGKRRTRHRASRFRPYVRFSFGPEAAVLDEALRRLKEVVARA
jgi:aspartate/methionine/tyrosine aminotransferase